MNPQQATQSVPQDKLRDEIQHEYSDVADDPSGEFHFHTGRDLAVGILDYPDDWVDALPDQVVESFAGTGNPFAAEKPQPGDRIVDVGCGTGMDSFIAADMVGPSGQVIGVDMTEAMLRKAREGASKLGLGNIEFRQGYAEDLPVADGWADRIISNGVMNLCPDKAATFEELKRVLTPGGRLQIGDIVNHKPVPDEARCRIDLWTG